MRRAPGRYIDADKPRAQAPTLLTLLMVPVLRREAAAAAAKGTPPPRVVFVSSIMHLVGALDLNDPDYTGTCCR